MRRLGIPWGGRRKRPCHPVGQDGEPKVAPNAVDGGFGRGAPPKAVSAGITCLPCRDGGFAHMSGILGCRTSVPLAHKCPVSMGEDLVPGTYDQLRGLDLPDGIWACPDRGVHCTARACRDRLGGLGTRQSMPRRACCWDDACIEGFWGRMKGQMGDTAHLLAEEVMALVDRCVDYHNNLRPFRVSSG